MVINIFEHYHVSPCLLPSSAVYCLRLGESCRLHQSVLLCHNKIKQGLPPIQAQTSITSRAALRLSCTMFSSSSRNSYLIRPIPAYLRHRMTREIAANKNPERVRIFVVRHGRTDWNARKILQGQIDIAINDEGKEQAQKLGHYFKGIKLDRVVSSDLSRCFDTVDCVLDHQDGPDFSVTADLRERCMGKILGLALLEALAKYGEDFRRHGEKDEDLVRRVLGVWNRTLKEARADSHRNILLCTHGGLICAFTNYLHEKLKYKLGPGVTEEHLRVPYNCSVSVFDVDLDTGEGTIDKFGITEHLGAGTHSVDQLLR